MRATTLAAADAAILLGLVAPLAFAPTTWQQRGALAVVLFAFGTLAAGARGWRVGRTPAVGGVVVALALVAVTWPLAGRAERAAQAASEARAGERLMALNEPAAALPRFDQALRLDAALEPAKIGGAHARYELAERDVQAGMSAASYAKAGDELDAALALAPDPDAKRLADAVAAVRQADQIWNQYDWPRTIGELEKAYAVRPDLPGLREKLYAAEVSYAGVLIAQGAWADADVAMKRAHEVNPGA